jgi:hypothetical protein
MKNPSKENGWRSEVLIVAGTHAAVKDWERPRMSVAHLNFFFGRSRQENVVRPIGLTLEFKRYAGVQHNRASRFADTHHGPVTLIGGSQMIQRSTIYPIKMAALVVCHVSLLTMLVWMFR